MPKAPHDKEGHARLITAGAPPFLAPGTAAGAGRCTLHSGRPVKPGTSHGGPPTADRDTDSLQEAADVIRQARKYGRSLNWALR